MSKHKVELRWNLSCIDEPCAICGGRCHPTGEIDSFLLGTLDLVCDYCVREARKDELEVKPNQSFKTVTEDECF
jgi:hypothetical protein